MVSRATDVQSLQQWQVDPFEDRTSEWVLIFRRLRGALGFCIAAALVLIGWLARDRHWIAADHGIGLVLGIVSACCMLILLLYPLRKRFRALKFIGPLPKWFRNHMILGISAPIAALYHCNFQGGSLNSRIALFSAIAVASSGLIGRFIYSKVHHGLYGRKANLKELLASVKTTTPGVGKLGAIIPELMTRMTRFDKEVLVPPKGILDCVKLPLVLSFRTRIQYFRLARFVKISLAYQSHHSAVVAEHQTRLNLTIRLYVRNHLRHVRRVAEFVAYERLLSLWHKIHFPFFVVLFVSVTVHVAVVYLY